MVIMESHSLMELKKIQPKIKSFYSWRYLILPTGITLFLFAAAVKPGLSSELETVTYSGLIAYLRDYSQYIGALGLSLLLYVYARQPKLKTLDITYPAIWFLIFKSLITLRLISTPEFGLGQLVSLISIFLLYFIISARDGTPNCEKYYKSIINGMYYLAVIILLLNFYLYLFEYTNTSWKGRFVGVFHHPNFAGVNFAICASIIFSYNNTHNKDINKISTITSGILIVLSAFLVMASGSRTGILGFGAALLGYLYIQKYLKARTILFMAFIGMILLISLDSIIELFASYIPGIDRILQAGNTRDGVWTSMWADFISNPLFGAGSSVKDTAGSYLRVLAIGGVIAGLPLLICILLCVARILRNRKHFKFRDAWLPGLLCILITSITEGYLADALSLGLIYFVFIVFALSLRRPIQI